MLRAGLRLLATMLVLLGPAKAQQLPLEIKAQILQDIKDKESALKTETDKLRSLYLERDTLNPDARINEIIEKSTKMSGEALKLAIEEATSGFKDTPKKMAAALDRANNAKNLIKDVFKAQEKTYEDLDRQEVISGEISNQEKRVREAASALGAAKAAALIVGPMLDAMEAERIAAIKQIRIDNQHRSDPEAHRQLDTVRGRGPPRSGVELSGSGPPSAAPPPATSTSPTLSGTSTTRRPPDNPPASQPPSTQPSAPQNPNSAPAVPGRN